MRKPILILAGLVAAFSLTAAGYGARGLIHGKDIAPNSIGTKHLVDHTIQPQDLSASAVSTLRGHVGPQGPAGPAGEAGPQGPAGIPGLQFMLAESAYDSSSPKTVQVNCPAGKRALSWSFSIVLAGTDYADRAPALESVGPVDFDAATGKLPGAWIGKATELGAYPNSWRLTMYAVCI